ncbi:MAG: protein translocase subunit SecD, partial [bacterium]|nr:protein translocase subunit SecD [bacterium]
MFGFEVLSLLAQTDTATAATGSWLDGIIMLALIVAVVVVPFLLGNFVANSVLKMREYGWKIGLIFFAITASFVVILLGWPPNLGVDLQGGTILVYEIQDQEDGAPPIDKGALIQQLSRRVNPTGTREIVIRPYGEREIEIIIPKLPPDEIERIKDILRQQGALEFRIVADTTEPRHDDAIKEARKPENSREEIIRSSTKTINETNDGFDVDESKQKVIGYWTKMGRAAEELSIAVPEFTDASGKSVKRIRPFLSEGLIGGPHLFRIAATDQPLDVTQLDLARPEVSLAKLGIGDIEVFMFADDGWDVIGDDIASVRQSIGSDRGGNEVAFNMNTLGAPKMAGLTGAYSPDSSTGKDYHMGIVLDNELISAPTIQSTISDSGRITGRFTNAEIKFLVEILQAGKLPATLSKAPISENVIDPLLGAANVVQGCWAIGISFGLVLIFMLVYYRIAGVVACFALGANIALILAVMIAIKAAFTLPGLAGLVLTVGMAVDANVLIFERIREEMNRGSALRLAIRNGFAKATTTIVDANVTTLITAIVLYAIGTDQIRGFAVTLILGIVMSMFTAIFCSRVTFEIIERKKWLTSLNMMQALTETSFNFLGKRRIALAVSAVVIVIGLVAVGFRGATIFDIDFRGGYSVSFALSEVKTTEEVRNLLDPAFKALGDEAGESTQFTLVKVGGGEGYEGRIFKLDASIPSQEGETPEATTSRLKSLIATTLSGLLEKRTVTISDEAVNTPETPAPEETSAVEDPFGLLNQGESFITLLDDPSEEAPAVDGSDDTEPADPAATEPTDEKPEEPAEPAAEPNDPAEPVSDGSEPTAPVEPSDTPEPTDPAEPTEPAEPTDAAEPAADSAEPTDPKEPAD